MIRITKKNKHQTQTFRMQLVVRSTTTNANTTNNGQYKQMRKRTSSRVSVF